MVVLTFNEQGHFQGSLQTKGQAVSSRSGQLVCRNNALYAATVVDVNKLQSIYLYRWSLDSEEQQGTILQGVKVNDKNVIQVKALHVDKDGKTAYIAGGLNGGLQIDQETLEQPSGKLVPFIVQYDLTEGKAVAGYAHESTGIGGASALFERQDTIYVFEYDWGVTSGNRVRLAAFDKQLKRKKEIGLLNTKAMETSKDAVLAGGDVIFNINTGKGATLSFVADPEATLTTPVISGFVGSVHLFDSAEPSGVEDVHTEMGVSKSIHNGQVVIIRNRQMYSITGQKL